MAAAGVARASTLVTQPVPHIQYVLCSVSVAALRSPSPAAHAAGLGGALRLSLVAWSADVPFVGARCEVETALVHPCLEPRVALLAGGAAHDAVRRRGVTLAAS